MYIHAIHTIQRGDKDDPKVIAAGFKGDVDLREQEVIDLLANRAIEVLPEPDEPELPLQIEPANPVQEPEIIITNEDVEDEPEVVEVDEPEFNPIPEIVDEPVSAAPIDREALEARALELKVEFRSNISDAKLAERVAAAESDGGLL